MRRVAGIGTAGAVAAAGALLIGGGGAQAQGEFRVDAIFDTAKGIVPGQLVKIAGARVGEVSDVVLTPDYKARMVMTVDGRFAPFRADARCEIQPEGLISENFVQCDPGTPGAPELTGDDGEAPTVPIERTSVPVNLTDLFDIWRVPVRERLSVLISALGNGLAARGEEVNSLLRRANPALAATNRTLDILRRQRSQLAGLVRSADAVAAELARRPERIERFVDSSARVLSRTARHRSDLEEGIRRLPAMLAATEPAFRQLDDATANLTPLLRDLRRAGPGLDQLVGEIAPFATAARPTLRELSTTSDVGRRTIKSARPVVARLRQFSAAALPTGAKLAPLLTSLRDRGFVENLLKFSYVGAASSARYDRTSHIIPAHLLVTSCATFATTENRECSARYNSAATTPRPRREQSKAAAPNPPKAQQPATGPTPVAPKLPDTPVTPGGKLPRLEDAPKAVTEAAEKLLEQLVGDPDGDAGPLLPDLLELLLG